MAWKTFTNQLASSKTTIDSIDPRILRDYIGGRGLAIHYLYKEMDPMVEPFLAENKLIFATGPLTATTAPTGNRYMVVTKSPLTGALAHSNSGGDFPTWMKRSGFDLYIFEGKAEHGHGIGARAKGWQSPASASAVILSEPPPFDSEPLTGSSLRAGSRAASRGTS